MKQLYLLSFSFTFLAHGICNDLSSEEHQEQFQLVNESDAQALAHQPSSQPSPRLGVWPSRNAPYQKSTEQEECLSPYHRMHVSIRQNESKGIGYNHGYTTLEAFGIYDGYSSSFMPFIDIRGHVFNDGKLAGNLGIGERTLLTSINHTFGSYLYYDVRRVGHGLTVNQLSPGVELVGERMEYRINGYFPIGKEKGRKYGYAFDDFKGHRILLKYKQQQAMMGGDAEVGVHLPQNTTYDIYAAAGPYYFHSSNAHAWGGRARLLGRYKEYVSLEVAYSYDKLFRSVVQGSVAFTVPFGGKLKRSGPCCGPRGGPRCGKDCPQTDNLLLSRAAFAPSRFEIPVVKKVHRREEAIDPATGQPWVVWFVNNTSHSAGTFESPFPTLAQAQNASAPNDMIYVFPGDGTSNGMNAGITLKNGQPFFSSSVEHQFASTKGTMIIPVLSAVTPTITNTGGNVITLGSNNTVSGFYIQNFNGVSITGTGISNFSALQNTIVGGTLGDGILLTNVSGQMVFNSNTFSQLDTLAISQIVHFVLNQNVNCSASFSNNTYYSQSTNAHAVNGIQADISNGMINNLSISGDNFIDLGQNGSTSDSIAATISGSGSINNWNVSECNFIGTENGITISLTSGSIHNLTVSNSSFIGNDGFGILLEMTSGSLGSLNISNSSFEGRTGVNSYGVQVATAGGTLGTFSVSNSAFSGYQRDGVLLDVEGGTVGTYSVSGATSNGNGGNGIQLNVLSGGVLNNFIVSDCTLNSNGGRGITIGVGTGLGAGTLNNVSISGGTFTGNLNEGIALVTDNAGSSVGTFNVSGGNYIGNDGNGITYESNIASTLGAFNVSGALFTGNLVNGIEILQGSGVFNGFSIANSTFNGNGTGGVSAALFSGTVQPIGGSVINNQFSVNGSPSINITNALFPLSLQISGNTFTFPGTTPDGYATKVAVSGGSTCLQFSNNNSTPVQSGVSDAYLFQQTGGTFNVEASGNTGTTHSVGTVGSTCP